MKLKDLPETCDVSLEVRPPSILRHHIDRFWFCGRSAVSVSEILPDGCVDVVFRLSASSIETLLFGPVTRKISFPLLNILASAFELVRLHVSSVTGRLRW